MKSVRGMDDLFGEELLRWRRVEEIVRNVFSHFGFAEIRTPALEKIEVFSRTVGDATDIVEKQMYTLTDISKEQLVLRPEGTASFMRAVIEHQLHQLAGPQRFFYYLPMFRHERPQKGRLRQFHQFGAELIQDPSPEADAEMISLVDTLFRKVGLREFRVRLNSVGCGTCRPAYRELLVKYLKGHIDQLCEQCKLRLERAPLRVFDCKNESCKNITAAAPLIADNLCAACSGHHRRVQGSLHALRVPYENDPTIVRGLDYYTRSAFEFTSSALGSQDALGGGGRYDGLSAQFGKANFPGVGFAAGMERVMIALAAAGSSAMHESKPSAFLAPLGEKAFELLYKMSFELKRAGVFADLSYDREKGLKNLLKAADKRGAAWAVVVGDDELAKGKALIKEMKTGTQEEIPISEIPTYLQTRINRAP
ncbi:MAG: histidine--tRNA ligase [Deltaproteobacteria bacterium]|nr:histidine--tRNA ligase [Deltaproteobacteria bacterium]